MLFPFSVHQRQHYRQSHIHMLFSQQFPINVRMTSITPPPLWRKLTSRQELPCSRGWSCNAIWICYKNNVVCSISLCEINYIGETHRTLQSRMREHIKPQSHVQKHYEDTHNISICSTEEFQFKILKMNFYDTAQRLAYERRMILKHKPLINIMYAGWRVSATRKHEMCTLVYIWCVVFCFCILYFVLSIFTFSSYSSFSFHFLVSIFLTKA